jgi:ATP-dependent protease ClpP protease subunit
MQKWYAIRPLAENNETEISIFDEIGAYGISAQAFLRELALVPDSSRIVLKIHSPGGEVFDGGVIFNALKRHPGGVVCQIEGLAASMASVIACAGMPVRMCENGFFMIHNPWTIAMGDSSEMRDQAALLDKIRSNMVGAYAGKSSQPADKIIEWMDAETWFTAAEAKAAGFVDEITDPLQAAASANRFKLFAKFRNAPRNLTPTPTQMENEPAPVDPTPAPVPAPEPVDPTPAPVDPAPVDPVLEDPAPVDPEAPAVPAASIIMARFDALSAERDAAIHRAEQAESALAAEREAMANLEQSLGVAAARVVPVIAPANAESDPVTDYIAANESGDRKAARAIFAKHKEAIIAYRRSLSKA